MYKRAQIQTSPNNMDKLTQPLNDTNILQINNSQFSDAIAVKSLKEINKQSKEDLNLKKLNQQSKLANNNPVVVQKLPQLEIGNKRSVSQKRDTGYLTKNQLKGMESNKNKRSLSNLNKISSQRKLIQEH